MEIICTMMANIRHIKGFTLLEILIVLIIISTISIIYLPHKLNIDLSHYTFIDNYQALQIEAIKDSKKLLYPNIYSLYPIYFNKKGDVNMAQTISINNHHLIIHLGNGYLTYE